MYNVSSEEEERSSDWDRWRESKNIVENLESTANAIWLWKDGAKTCDGEEVQESKCRNCEMGKEDYRYKYDEKAKLRDIENLQEILHAIVS